MSQNIDTGSHFKNHVCLVSTVELYCMWMKNWMNFEKWPIWQENINHILWAKMIFLKDSSNFGEFRLQSLVKYNIQQTESPSPHPPKNLNYPAYTFAHKCVRMHEHK